jgi:hypothetical protein
MSSPTTIASSQSPRGSFSLCPRYPHKACELMLLAHLIDTVRAKQGGYEYSQTSQAIDYCIGLWSIFTLTINFCHLLIMSLIFPLGRVLPEGASNVRGLRSWYRRRIRRVMRKRIACVVDCYRRYGSGGGLDFYSKRDSWSPDCPVSWSVVGPRSESIYKVSYVLCALYPLVSRVSKSISDSISASLCSC